MKKILVLLFIFACSANDKLVKVKFNHIYSTTEKQKIVSCKFNIPKGFKLLVYRADGEVGLSHIYKYPDSSFIYISDMPNNFNKSDIEAGGSSLEVTNYKLGGSTQNEILNLIGEDKSGLYWRSMFINSIEIGYSKVSSKNKTLFDNSIESYKKDNLSTRYR